MKDSYWRTDFSQPIEKRITSYQNSVTEDETYQGFDTSLLQNARFISAHVPSKAVIWEFEAQLFLCNKDGNMHGGAISTLLDNLTSTALYTIGKPGFWDSLGVSRSLIVHFLKPIPRGTMVVLECEVVSAGKKLALVKGTMRNVEGVVCATAFHEKVWTGSPQL